MTLKSRTAAVAILLAAPLAGYAQTEPAAPAPEHTFVPKISLYSEYEYRGISQTSEKPALQLNLDYTHSSGVYLGLFASNVRWLEDTAQALGGSTRGNLEIDLFGGYRKEFAKDWTLDAGYLRYEYPRSSDFFTNPKPNTDELYAGLSWKFLSAKVSYAVSDIFGVFNSKGSTFVEANLAYPINEKLTLTGNLGHQKFENNSPLDYTVYKLGLAYDLGDGWTVGGYYKGTDADGALYTFQGRDWSGSRAVGFASKSF